MAEEEKEEIDILHPLATLHWKQGPRLPIDGLFGAECVFVNNRLYMGSGIIFPEGRLRNNKQLFVFSANLDLLSESTTPTTEYALTTYNSQPMLVGGRLSSTFKLSNKLWVRNERKGIWNPSLLPPMPTARRYSSAINTGSTECIVVAGGFVDTGPVDVVEVLIGRQWSTLKPLPEPCGGMISTLHDGKWYLSHQDRDNIFCCNLKSLLSGYEQSNDVWSTINDVLSYRTASFGQQLIITLEGSEPSKSILALSPLTQSWVHVGGMPEEIVDFSTIVTIPSTRELVVIGEVYEDKDKNNVFLASLKMSPYNPDSQFSMIALNKLEETGLQIVSSLDNVCTELKDILGLNKLLFVREVISEWVSGRSGHPPTWRTLLDILRKLNLVELSQQIEDYLSGCAEDVSENLKTKGLSSASYSDSDAPKPNLSPAADSADMREFSEDLSSEDLYRYLLFKDVPRIDCDIIKEKAISGPCFLSLSIKYWENCGVSEHGVIVIMKLQTDITPNSLPHVAALDYQAYMSSLSPRVHPLLEQQLDWDHGGVDVDLNEIADHMLDWEDRLSAHLGLTNTAINDIIKTHLHQPPLQRQEALKRWRNRCGLRATYGNLLMLCVDAGHTQCAQVICDILNRKGRKEYLDAYIKILDTQDCIEMLFVKIIFLGPPRLGKTTARRRLTGKIADISSAAEPEQPSTGAVESGGNIVVRNISSITALMTPSEWSVMENHTEEACTLLQFIYDRSMELDQSHVPSIEGNSKRIHPEASSEKISNTQIISDKDSTSSSIKEQGSSDKPHGSTQEAYTDDIKASSSRNEKIPSDENEKTHSDKSVETATHPKITSDKDSSLKGQEGLDKPQGFANIHKLFQDALTSKNWKDIKRLFRNSALLKMEDTGGQPEFMDMLPALTIGPALYLLFCKLIDDLFSRYTVSYLSPTSSESTTPSPTSSTSVESSYTVEEVLLTALASVSCSCFRSYSAISGASLEEAHRSEVNDILTSSFKSVAYIVGTHKDLVSEEQIEAFDQQLRHSIQSTDFEKDLVQFSSEKRMILAIDNMKGGAEEIEKVRKFLEEGIRQHFNKLHIPASWLVFSLYLRNRKDRIASLDDCHQLAQNFNMPSKEIKISLWFLHHYAGFLMYYPDLPELKNTVICDTQIIYDSVTHLIINTFKFRSVGKWASERFRETGQFSLDYIRGATSKVSGDYIPLNQLVKLLEHLNIIAPIFQDNSHPSQTKAIQSSKVTYFMPCVLQNASCEELIIYSNCNPNLPASLMIRYKCGFVPLGIFPAIIAHLVGHSPLKLIEHGIKKNCIQFRYGTDRDTVTLIYRTKYIEIHIEREQTIVTPMHKVCLAVREIIESTLKAVSSRMNYAFSLCYQLSFECLIHPREDHLCVVDSTESNPHKMDCLKNAKNPQPVDMQSQHLVWFGKAMPVSEGCTSGSNLQPEGGGCLSLVNIKTFLKEEDFPADKAGELGTYLGINPGRISTLKSDNVGNADGMLSAILSEWLSNDGQSWEKLADVLRHLDHSLMADILREKANPLGGLSSASSPDSDAPKPNLSPAADSAGQPHTGVSPSFNISTVGDSTAYSIDHTSLESPPTKSYTTPPASIGLSRTRDASFPDSDVPKPKLPKLSPAADSADVREFSEDLSSEDLYRYLLFKHVPRRDCDIIKEEGISGLCFLGLSKEDWKDYGLSKAGVIAVARLQEMIKAADVREFSEDLSSEDLYKYLLFKNVPKRDCDIIKESDISGLSFLGLSIQYWESCGISVPGVVALTRLQGMIKAAQN